MAKLTENTYWDNSYKTLPLKPDNKKSIIIEMINKNFRDGLGKSVLEIGCFPGGILFYFGRNGYEVNGVDYSEYLYRLPDWFKKENFRIGEFIKADIDKMKIDKQYDVVFSAGFIEHFSNYEEKIKKHIEATKKNGYILITTPNFGGKIQKFLHTFLDKENLNRHYLPATNCENWVKTFEENGCVIKKIGYIGGFDFWTDTTKNNLLQKIIGLGLTLITPFKWMPNNKWYSPISFIIAKK